ncbi:hypothetical protein HWV62_29604 [Athelia sp. TMB]|nr:hypothetical protein HWV62_29604 [Athelia sp. TMB]
MSSSSLSSLSSVNSLGSIYPQSRDQVPVPETGTSASTSTSRASSATPTDADPSASMMSASARSRRKAKSKSTPQTQVLVPAHLEVEYARAYADLRAATIYALYRLGYTNPKRKSPDDAVEVPTLPMVLAAGFPDVERARRRVNEVDRKIVKAQAIAQAREESNTPPETEVEDNEEEEIYGGDEEEEEDGREEEVRQIWARFIEMESARKSEAPPAGRKKRKQPSDSSQDVFQSDRQLRRRVTVTAVQESSAVASRGTRARLRSTKVIRAH